MVRGAWRATVHGVAKSRTQLSMHTHTHNGTRKSWGEEVLRMGNGRSKRLGERKWGPDQCMRGRKRRSRGNGGRIRTAPCFLGTAPPSPVGPPSKTSPCHRTQRRTLGAASVSGSCQGPKHTSPATSSAQVSLGSQESPRARHPNRWQRSLQRVGPEGAGGRLQLVTCQLPQACPGGRQTASMKWMRCLAGHA